MSGERSPVHAVFGYPGRSLATAPLIASGFIIGLLAAVIADRIRAAVDDFAAVPAHDDVAVLVLAARPRDAYFR